MLAQRLPSPFKSGCMWGVLDDCLHTLMLDPVADCRLAWCTCSTSLSEREPWPCPRLLPQQAGSSALSSWCSWDLWGRMCVCVFRGLGGSAEWGQRKGFAVFPCALSLYSLSVGFCGGVACGPDSEGCTSWLWYIPFPNCREGLFLQPRVFWDLYPSYLFDIVFTVDTLHACLCHRSVPQTQTRSRVAQGQVFALWLADIWAFSWLLAMLSQLQVCQEQKFLYSRACLSLSRPLLLKTLDMASYLWHWVTVSPCPGASLLRQQVELKAPDTALISKELPLQLPSSGGLGILACFLLGFKIK